MVIRLDEKSPMVTSTDSSLPLATESGADRRTNGSAGRKLLKLLLVYFVFLFGADVWSRSGDAILSHCHGHKHGHKHGHGHHGRQQPVSCPVQGKALVKGKKWEVPANYTEVVAQRLSRAVQVPVSAGRASRSQYRA